MNAPALPAIRLFCDLSPGTGYNNAARGLIRALEHLGYDYNTLRLVPAVATSLSCADVDDDDPILRYTHAPWVGSVGAGLPSAAAQDPPINLVHLNPGMVGNYWTKGKYNIAYVSWETDALPKRTFTRTVVGFEGEAPNTNPRTVVDDLNDYDEVWVPAKFLVDVLQNSGVTTPVRVVPHALAFDPRDYWQRSGAQLRAGGQLRFYCIGSWNARKDPELLLRAYFAAGWNPMSPVDLQMFSVPPTRMGAAVIGHGMMAQQALRDIRGSLPDPQGAPGVGLHTTYVSHETVIRRHCEHHVLVSPSHGEAFCLPALEALALGNWVIGGGPWMEELAAVAGVIQEGGPVDLLPSTVGPIIPMPEVGGYEVGQNWWYIAQGELTNALREASNAARAEGWSPDFGAAERIWKVYSPAAVAEVIRRRLERFVVWGCPTRADG